jgi:hypothetical protein
VCIFIEKDGNEKPTKNKKKDRSKKQKGKKEHDNQISNCNQLENKLKWAVDEVKEILFKNFL